MWPKLWQFFFCQHFDAHKEAFEIFQKLGVSRHESLIEAKVIEYLYRFVSNDLKLAFSPRIIVACIVMDRMQLNVLKTQTISVDDVANAVGVPRATIEVAMKQGGKLTI
jgi:hypothetical protein